MFLDLIGIVTGKHAEYKNPTDLLHKTVGREVTRVENAGVVKVQFTIAATNMKALGF